MANKRYNKQVPGYKKGGKAKMMGGGVKRAKTLMMKRPMIKELSKRMMKTLKEDTPLSDKLPTRGLSPLTRARDFIKRNKEKRVKKMGGGMMMKRPMMKDGGKLKMVKNKEGKMVPFYAADGVGKMKKGGMAKLNPGLRKFLTKKKRGKKNG